MVQFLVKFLFSSTNSHSRILQFFEMSERALLGFLRGVLVVHGGVLQGIEDNFFSLSHTQKVTHTEVILS